MPINGLNELSKKLNQLKDNAKELGEVKSASLTDILTPEFVSRHTRFANADEFFEASGFNVTTQAEFEAIPEHQLDAFVSSESAFDSWRDLLNAGGAEWAKRKLGL